MTLSSEDLFVVQRIGADPGVYSTTTQDIKNLTLDGGFTGDVVVDGQTLTFQNGLLVSVA